MDASALRAFNAPAPEDYYALLSLDLDEKPSQEDIKSSYRKLQRSVHPDIIGDSATALAVVLNACYSTLSNENLRAVYDQQLREYRKIGGTFDGRAVSRWSGPTGETRAVFVAENECIGCTNCTRIAPSTFFLEDEHGRARVGTQWADDEDCISEAVQSCPVDCIYYVDKAQLPLLEFLMKGCKRENPGLMGRRRSGNMGPPPACECPFDKAATFVRTRKNVEVKEAASSGRPLHDGLTAAAIARAWLDLPSDARDKGWPEWADGTSAPSSSAPTIADAAIAKVVADWDAAATPAAAAAAAGQAVGFGGQADVRVAGAARTEGHG
ncbi:hypothetical protein FOA52_003523 [Chlamydomonas sp. UWO 241]|nr:hypothetical protein FOA52_003523 [Chlamydomonas sp. UWO 241]